MKVRSTAYWEQNDLALRNAGPLTALTVEVHVALTGSVQQTGSWRTLPSDDFSVTIQQTGHSLVYRWVLKAGRTVPPGQHVFAVQFNHATGTRSAAGDNYRVDAQGQAGGAVSVWGGFAGRWTAAAGAETDGRGALPGWAVSLPAVGHSFTWSHFPCKALRRCPRSTRTLPAMMASRPPRAL
ncbi:hypothetical protein [Streptomyces sp. NBC_00285]|uniref:hypothetical protein n=1 Tax=Streptomyces sp. NBC_00285 TaxID=2975700 RepID=UPI002E2C6FB0|nr:hypothetical protein [Streptomyces sp. NBC_00285]